MRKQNKLVTVNKHNKKMFAQGVDREHNNIFDGARSSIITTPYNPYSIVGNPYGYLGFTPLTEVNFNYKFNPLDLSSKPGYIPSSATPIPLGSRQVPSIGASNEIISPINSPTWGSMSVPQFNNTYTNSPTLYPYSLRSSKLVAPSFNRNAISVVPSSIITNLDSKVQSSTNPLLGYKKGDLGVTVSDLEDAIAKSSIETPKKGFWSGSGAGPQIVGAVGNMVGSAVGNKARHGYTGGGGAAIGAIGSTVGGLLMTNPATAWLGAGLMTASPIIGAFSDRTLGTKRNEDNINAALSTAGTAKAIGDWAAKSQTSSGLMDAARNMTSNLGLQGKDYIKKGWARRLLGHENRAGNKYRDMVDTAIAMQNHGIELGEGNIARNYKENALVNFGALGGLLNMGNIDPATAIGYDLLHQNALSRDTQANAKGNAFTNLFAGAPNMSAKGGKIHIKEKNRGKFTEQAKRAGMGVQEFASHVLANKGRYSPSTVKRANFAHNAKNWAAYGGLLDIDNPLFAFGGNLEKNGADYPTGLIHIDEGGSHEENPYQGVQMGVDPQGTPNLVEEGETIFNDYVFSNRIFADGGTLKKFHLNEKREITYADLAKKLEKEISERPNDPISQAAFDRQMAMLAEEQERQKQEEQAREAQEAFAQLPPEEQVALMQQEQQAQEQGMEEQAAQEQMMQQQPSEEEMMAQQMAAQQQMPPQGIMPQGITPDMIAQQGMPMMGAYGGLLNQYGYGGNLFALGGPDGGGQGGGVRESNGLSPTEKQQFIDAVSSYGKGNTRSFEKLPWYGKIAYIASDPIGYFGGDLLDAIGEKISEWTQPQLKKFFKTDVGKYVADAIVRREETIKDSPVIESGSSRGRMIAGAFGRIGRPIATKVVQAARQQLASSKHQARGQGQIVRQQQKFQGTSIERELPNGFRGINEANINPFRGNSSNAPLKTGRGNTDWLKLEEMATPHSAPVEIPVETTRITPKSNSISGDGLSTAENFETVNDVANIALGIGAMAAGTGWLAADLSGMHTPPSESILYGRNNEPLNGNIQVVDTTQVRANTPTPVNTSDSVNARVKQEPVTVSNSAKVSSSLDWLNKNHPEIPVAYRKEYAKAMDKRLSARHNADSSGNPNYSFAFGNLTPSFNRSDSNLRRHFDNLVKDGVSRNAAFQLVYPKSLFGEDKQSLYNRSVLYNQLVSKPRQTSQKQVAAKPSATQNRKQTSGVFGLSGLADYVANYINPQLQQFMQSKGAGNTVTSKGQSKGVPADMQYDILGNEYYSKPGARNANDKIFKEHPEIRTIYTTLKSQGISGADAIRYIQSMYDKDGNRRSDASSYSPTDTGSTLIQNYSQAGYPADFGGYNQQYYQPNPSQSSAQVTLAPAPVPQGQGVSLESAVAQAAAQDNPAQATATNTATTPTIPVNPWDNADLSLGQRILTSLDKRTWNDFIDWAKENKLTEGLLGEDLSKTDWEKVLADPTFRDALGKLDDTSLAHALRQGYDYGNYKYIPKPADIQSINVGNWSTSGSDGDVKKFYDAWKGSTDEMWKQANITGEEKSIKEIQDKLMATDAWKKTTDYLKASPDNMLNYLQAIESTPDAPEKAKAHYKDYVSKGEDGKLRWNDKASKMSAEELYDKLFHKVRTTLPGTYWHSFTPATQGEDTLNFIQDKNGNWAPLETGTDGLTLKRQYKYANDNGNHTLNYYISGNGNAVEKDAANKAIEELAEGKYDIRPRHKDSWMRYAPLFGAPINLGLMAAGVGKPKLDRYDAALAGYEPVTATYEPVGGYMAYSPMDIWAAQNSANAQARAISREIVNNASPIGQRMAGDIALAYNNDVNEGKRHREAMEYDDKLRQATTAHNLGVDVQNAQAFNALSQYNASALNNYRQNLAGLRLNIADKKNEAEADWYNQLYGNIGQGLTALGKIGNENEQFNMMAELAALGVFGPMNPRSAWGSRFFEIVPRDETTGQAAKGGKIRKRKGGLTY